MAALDKCLVELFVSPGLVEAMPSLKKALAKV